MMLYDIISYKIRSTFLLDILVLLETFCSLFHEYYVFRGNCFHGSFHGASMEAVEASSFRGKGSLCEGFHAPFCGNCKASFQWHSCGRFHGSSVSFHGSSGSFHRLPCASAYFHLRPLSSSDYLLLVLPSTGLHSFPCASTYFPQRACLLLVFHEGRETELICHGKLFEVFFKAIIIIPSFDGNIRNFHSSAGSFRESALTSTGFYAYPLVFLPAFPRISSVLGLCNNDFVVMQT